MYQRKDALARLLPFLACGLLALTTINVTTGCLSKAGRACRSDADCPSTSAARYCFKGTCSEQACEPGQVALCFDGDPAQANKGICRNGTKICSDKGLWQPCLGQILPQQEICDRVDNDCDGKVDQEDTGADGKALDCTCKPGAKQACYSGPPDTLKPGQDPASWPCQEGIQYCELDNLWGPCYADSPPSAEVCDRADNDCDGQTDEGINCTCTPGTKRTCPNRIPKRGTCQPGEQSCEQDGKWGACQGPKPPTPEVCDGKDNDCDGQIDSPRLDCASHLLCIGGRCQCPQPLVDCNGACIVVEQNSQNCGGCGKVCPAGTTCNAGKCVCPQGQTLCGNTCTNTQINAKHCGSCDKECREKEFCQAGQCTQCPANAGTCGDTCCQNGQSCCDKVCVDQQTDANHCGQCSQKCAAGQICCGGTCADTSTSTDHCGTCGQKCAAGQQCCSGKCVDQNDRLNCGACGKICAQGEACCSGVCTPVRQNNQNCGACGQTCKQGESCCGLDGCVDATKNSNHCGKCDNKCQAGETCCGGNCHYQICPTTQPLSDANLASVTDIAVDQNGNYYVVGNFRTTFAFPCGPGQPKTLTSTGDQDIFILKFNAQGSCIWMRGAGGKEKDTVHAVAVTSDNYAHLTGAVTSNFRFYSPTQVLKNLTNKISATHVAFILSIENGGDMVGTLDTAEDTAISVGYDITTHEGNDKFAVITGEINAVTRFGNATAYGVSGRRSMFVASLKLSTREFIWAWPGQSQPTKPLVGYGISYSPSQDVIGVSGVELSTNKQQTVIVQTHAVTNGARVRHGSRTIVAPDIGWLAIAAADQGGWYTAGHSAATLGQYTFADGFVHRWRDDTSSPSALKQDWAQPTSVFHLASRNIVAYKVGTNERIAITGGFQEIGLGGTPRFGVGIAQFDASGNRLVLREATAKMPALANGLTILPTNGDMLVVGHFQAEIDFAPPVQKAANPSATAGFIWRLRIKP